MKKLILLASVSFVLHTSLYAQTTPRVLSYQGVIRSVSNLAGNHSMIVTLYADANGTIKLWQSTINTPIDSTGVFNCTLGSAANPLPEVTSMDRPLWLGVSIDGTSELRPLSEVTASAFALNVADSSISTNKMLDNSITTNKLSDQSVTTTKLADSSVTASKLNTNYVSSISVNGQTITGVGTNLNLVAGDGLNLTWIPEEGSLLLSGNGESGGGNSRTLSTGDRVALTNAAGIAVMGGVYDVTTTDILHGGNPPTYSPVNLSTDVGTSILGCTNGGTGGTPRWSTTVAAGGNTATDYSSTVSGGAAGLAENFAATVSGGYYNASYGDDGVVAGGEGNTVGVDSADPASYHSAISGGANNSIRGANSAIAGGTSLLLGPFSFGFNGDNDTGSVTVRGDPVPRVAALTNLSDTLGGPNFSQIAYFGNVDLLLGNVDGSARSLVFYSPNTSRVYSGATYTSFAAGTQSTNINYTLPTVAPDSLGWVLGVSSISGTNIGLQWERNDTGSGGGGGIPAWYLTGNSSVPAPSHFLGTIDSEIFEIHVHDGAATSTGGNKRVMQYSEGPLSPDILGGSSANFLYAEKYSGAAILSGGSSFGPNMLYANFSAIVGGAGNLISDGSGYTSGGGDFIGAGEGDTIDDLYGLELTWYDVISGGDGNAIHSSWSSTISGGQSNSIDSDAIESTIGGGNENYIGKGAMRSVISGGTNNKIYDQFITISGGIDNTINLGAKYTSITGGAGNTINTGSAYASILGGYTNQISTKSSSFGFIIGARGSGGGWIVGTYDPGYQTISGGQQNTVLSTGDVIAGGVWNHIDTNSVLGTISGGGQDTILAPLGTICGGTNNHISPGGIAATIAGGYGLIAQSQAQFVTGEYNTPEGSGIPDTNDQIAIFGNGRADTVRSDAFTVAIGGYSTAYDNMGSGSNPTNSTRLGSTYGDNTIEAWGNIAAGGTVLADIGVLGVSYDTSSKIYTITLNVANQNGSPHTFAANECSVVATINQSTAGGPAIIEASSVNSSGQFTVQTWPGSSSIATNSIGYFFHVVLR